MVWPALLILGISLMPESPRYALIPPSPLPSKPNPKSKLKPISITY